jgi:hypothetical protein
MTAGLPALTSIHVMSLLCHYDVVQRCSQSISDSHNKSGFGQVDIVMKFFLRSVFVLAMVLSQVCSAEPWVPITGIPTPPFGANLASPTLPSDWSSEVPGFYYVCGNCAGGSNASLGTPTNPRGSLPNNIAGGDVVVIAGSFNALNLNFGCTVDAPCFLLGDPDNPPTALGESSLSGRYYVVDGVNFGLSSNDSGSTLAMGGTYGVVRNGSISGNNESGGAYTGGQYLLVQKNFIHDNGDVNVSSDQDRHGLKIGGTNIWVIGNEFTRNSGDGVQVGGLGSQNSVQNIYIGGNTTYDNKQTGIWVKESRHVIVSSNLAYGHSPSGSSDGEGIGGQYDSQYVWVIFNEIRNNTGGVGFKSSKNGGGTKFYVVGNYIHDNINNNYDPGYAGSRTAIASRNGADITIVNNTLDGNSGGINLMNTGGAYVYNNAITNMRHPNGIAINTSNSNQLRYSDYNATDGDPVVDAGTAPYAAKNPYSIFQAQYGLSILYDVQGNARPVGNWDIGAFESSTSGAPRPKPPADLIAE